MFPRLVSANIRWWRHLLPGLLDQQAVSESGVIMISAMVVGAGACLGAVFFRWLIKTVQTLAYGGFGGGLQNISHLYLLIIPAIGGAIYGPLIYRFAREAKGHGVPEVMEAVTLHRGRIRPQVNLKTLMIKWNNFLSRIVSKSGEIIENNTKQQGGM